jgi:hypothetical protein
MMICFASFWFGPLLPSAQESPLRCGSLASNSHPGELSSRQPRKRAALRWIYWAHAPASARSLIPETISLSLCRRHVRLLSRYACRMLRLRLRAMRERTALYTRTKHIRVKKMADGLMRTSIAYISCIVPRARPESAAFVTRLGDLRSRVRCSLRSAT